MSPVKASEAIRLVGIDKSFGGLAAVRGAELTARCGVLSAVVGENGAGKSTLLKIAAGILQPDRGEVWVSGELQSSYDARRAAQLGVAMVQQHFALFGGLTALENLILGVEPLLPGGRIDLTTARAKATRVLRELGASLPLDANVDSFGVGDRQRLEIARALYRDARVVILDEPTAVLTPSEASDLYATLRRMVGQEGGERSVIVVTHKLDEVERHVDTVTVMRRGQTLASRAVARGAEVTRLSGEIIGGQPLPDLPPRAAVAVPGDIRLSIRDVTRGRELRGVSLDVRSGEIVGIAGVLGNGQSELLMVLGGLLEPDGGSVEGDLLEVVHEDRQTEGLVLDATVAENLVLGSLRRFTRGWLVDDEAIAREARERIARFDVRPADEAIPVRALSGGNQQKVVLARALARDPRVLVVAHPTRGVDLLAARAIHEQILAAASRGVAVLLVSADLTELRVLCDRILVMVRGRITSELSPTAGDETLGAAMLAVEAP